MDIQIAWRQPLELKDGSRQGLIYALDLDEVPGTPGVYVFARRFGQTVTPLYIGQAQDLRRRVKQQLEMNVRLMKGLEAAEAGARVLLLGVIQFRPGQQVEKVLEVVESAIIQYALAQGHEILNKQGKHRPSHLIRSQGNQWSQQIIGRQIRVRQQA